MAKLNAIHMTLTNYRVNCAIMCVCSYLLPLQIIS